MLTLNFQNVMSDTVSERDGITQEELNIGLKNFASRYNNLLADKNNKKFAFTELPYQEGVAKDIISFAQESIGTFKNFVHIGIGGSVLGAKAIHTALSHPLYNQIASKERNYWPKVYFLDNVDPDETYSLLEFLDPQNTLFHIVSKSGETTETLATFLIILKRLKDICGDKFKRNIVITTDATKGFLRSVANSEGIRTFSIPEGVGGRFSALSAVGLLTAAFSGIDISVLLSGAREMDKIVSRENPAENPAFIAAFINYTLDTKKGKHILVTMPYAYALKDIADWFRQLWAESLGKKDSLDGSVINCGQTPISALGVTDQHSQIQLYNEGPNDKIVSFIEVEKFRCEVNIPSLFEGKESVEFLHGKKLSELMRAEKLGTEAALVKNNRPNYTITLPDISPATVGGFLYFLEMQTLFAGALYDVNPFDQPGVDAGKEASYVIMGRKGYSEKQKGLSNFLNQSKKYIIR
ncbi:MAG: hypothetical protein A2W23_08915 [Planctomycetes bacterium RBG_16_43_13]|nr:MAG: hypothetical protein A2W23_08915 [Planctomycetes bacterium RBG_16_43_13]